MTEDFLSSHCQAVEEVPETNETLKLMGETPEDGGLVL